MGNEKTKEFFWDFFIAHSHKDKDTARELYNCIKNKDFTAFLDQETLQPGSQWDIEIPKAQKQSRATIALISNTVTQAYYARDEIHAAIQLTRTHPDHHKLIPVYLNDASEDNEGIIYGLRLIQGIKLSAVGNIENLALLLCNKAQTIHREKEIPMTKELHILTSFPPGPMVELTKIPRSIIEMYAKLIREPEARLVISEANSFRQEANPETQFIIPLYKIPSPEKIPAFDFWIEAFNYAGLQGPRMLAALLLIVPDDHFITKAKEARKNLLESLKHHS